MGIAFRNFIESSIRIKDKKWIPPKIDGYDIEYNNDKDHQLNDRVDRIIEYYKTLDKDKHNWLKELSRTEVILNLQDKVHAGINKIKDEGTEEGVSIAVYFKKSKFIALYLVKTDYIRLNTILHYNAYVVRSKKSSMNEKMFDKSIVLDI